MGLERAGAYSSCQEAEVRLDLIVHHNANSRMIKLIGHEYEIQFSLIQFI